MTDRARGIVLLFGFAGAILPASAVPIYAHRLAPSLLELRPLDGNRYAVLWRTPVLQPSGTSLRPVLPPRCHPEGPRAEGMDGKAAGARWVVSCGPGGLTGAVVAVDGLRRSKTDALVRISLPGGKRTQALLHDTTSAVFVPRRDSWPAVARGSLWSGISVLLAAPGQVLFALGLALFIADRRQLLPAVAALTAGHSLTLSLAVYGFAGPPRAPVELVIALSPLLLAAEFGDPDGRHAPRLRHRMWLVAFASGLLHGFGFAAALHGEKAWLHDTPLAVLGINVGIEAGQLALVAAGLACRSLGAQFRSRAPLWARFLPTYAIGSLAALWCIECAVGWL